MRLPSRAFAAVCALAAALPAAAQFKADAGAASASAAPAAAAAAAAGAAGHAAVAAAPAAVSFSPAALSAVSAAAPAPLAAAAAPGAFLAPAAAPQAAAAAAPGAAAAPAVFSAGAAAKAVGSAPTTAVEAGAAAKDDGGPAALDKGVDEGRRFFDAAKSAAGAPEDAVAEPAGFRAKLDALRAAYAQPENAGLSPVFHKQDGAYVELRGGVRFDAAELARIGRAGTWGAAPRVLGDLPGYKFEGLDAQGRALVRELATQRTRAVPLGVEGASALIADAQTRNKALYDKEVSLQFMNVTVFPFTVPLSYRKGFSAIRSLLSDKNRFFRRLQEMELDVARKMWMTGETNDQALQDVLGEWETANGFKPVIMLKWGLEKEAWNKMIRDGALFHDASFANVVRGGQDDKGPHGGETHRIQWHVIMREMKADPQAFGDVTQAVELYKRTGESYGLRRVTLGLAGRREARNVWNALLDSIQYDYTSPEFTRPKHKYVPITGMWDSPDVYRPARRP